MGLNFEVLTKRHRMNPMQLKVKFSGLVTFNFQSGEREAWVIFGKLSVEPGLEFPAIGCGKRLPDFKP